MTDDEIDRMGSLGEFWRSLILAANAGRRRRDLRVEIVPLSETDRQAVAPTFWRLLGDLVATVLLDGVDGPWGTSEPANGEILAS
jgi:hypothetical protein